MRVEACGVLRREPLRPAPRWTLGTRPQAPIGYPRGQDERGPRQLLHLEVPTQTRESTPAAAAFSWGPGTTWDMDMDMDMGRGRDGDANGYFRYTGEP